jgi:hypothetical protein
VAARAGRHLFDEGDAPYHLRTVSTEVYGSGVIRVVYAPVLAPGNA